MKKIIIILALVALIILPTSAYASQGLIKPNSRIYFVQNWGESIRYFFTFTKNGKVNYLLILSDRRVDEIKSVESEALIEKLSARYENHYQTMEKLAAKVKDKNAVSQKIRETSIRQQEVLADVYQKVPESAQSGVVNAQENSAKHVSATVKNIEGETVAQEYAQRVQTIQQAAKVNKMQMAPMESGGPAGDPSQTPKNSLKSTNPLNPLNDPNSVNDTDGDGTNVGTDMVEPVAPATQQPLR